MRSWAGVRRQVAAPATAAVSAASTSSIPAEATVSITVPSNGDVTCSSRPERALLATPPISRSTVGISSSSSLTPCLWCSISLAAAPMMVNDWQPHQKHLIRSSTIHSDEIAFTSVDSSDFRHDHAPVPDPGHRPTGRGQRGDRRPGPERAAGGAGQHGLQGAPGDRRSGPQRSQLRLSGRSFMVDVLMQTPDRFSSAVQGRHGGPATDDAARRRARPLRLPGDRPPGRSGQRPCGPSVTAARPGWC